jgi:hypothetical protein
MNLQDLDAEPVVVVGHERREQLVDGAPEPKILTSGHDDPVRHLDRDQHDQIERAHRVAELVPVDLVTFGDTEVRDEVERRAIDEGVRRRCGDDLDRSLELKLEVLGRRRIGKLVALFLEREVRLVDGFVPGQDLREGVHERCLARAVRSCERDPHLYWIGPTTCVVHCAMWFEVVMSWNGSANAV